MKNLKDIDERFKTFIEANPHVFRLFQRFAHHLRAKGHNRYSADAILHRIRWHMNVDVKPTGSTDEFKINDHYSSRLARLLIERDPTYEGFFELRELRAKKTTQPQ